jgi:hypothetical protein
MPRLVLLLAALAGPAVAGAKPDPAGDTGLVLGARAGYAVAFGRFAAESVDVRDVVEAKLPLGLGLGYRFGRHLRGEFFFELAPASVDDTFCTPSASCSASDLRFGLALEIHLSSGAPLDPWVGVGFGIEVLNAQLSDAEPLAPAGRNELTWAGIELPLLAGIDFAVSDQLSVGPFVSGTFGSFTSLSRRPQGGARASGAIDERDTHGWLHAGLRMALRL